MSFLVLPAGLDMRQVVASIWFRAPTASVEAAQADFADHFGVGIGGAWKGLIPLVAWGSQSTGETNNLVEVDTDLLPPEYGGGLVTTYGPGAAETIPQGAGYIGIRCLPDNDPILEVYIPIGAPASCTNCVVELESYALLEPPEVQYNYGDFSADIEEIYDDYFGGRSQMAVTPDVIHHALISWDITNGSSSVGGGESGATLADSVLSSSLMWMAFDGDNKTGADLPMNWPGDDFNVNRHVSYLTGVYGGVPTRNNGEEAAVTSTVGALTESPISIPGPAEIDVDGGTGTIVAVRNVLVGPVQIFTGVVLDTSVEAHIHAFRTTGGRPANPSLAADLLGKEPEVLVRKVIDFQEGNNRGTAGDFTPTGTIAEYTPTYP